jgi:hypothetical protein
MEHQAHLTFSNRYDMRRNSAFILRTFEQLQTNLPEHPPVAPTVPPTLPETR